MRKEVKKKMNRRLKIIEGQIKGLQKMVEDDVYCINIITQTSAARQALSSIENIMLENHLEEHVKVQMKGKDFKKATKEILGVYKLAKKK